MSVFTNPADRAPEQAQAYVEAILGLLGDKDPVSVLRETSTLLARFVESTPAIVMTRPEVPGKWSMGQVLAHLADCDLVWGWRLRLILSQHRPTLTGFDQDAWAERLGYADIDPKDSLAMFSILRKGNLHQVERATDEDLDRVGIHVERGEESLRHHLQLYAGHDLLHLSQLERIRTAVA